MDGNLEWSAETIFVVIYVMSCSLEITKHEEKKCFTVKLCNCKPNMRVRSNNQFVYKC